MSLSSRVGNLASRLALEMKDLRNTVELNHQHIPYTNIHENFPTVDFSVSGSRIAISRTGDVVELLIAAVMFKDITAFPGGTIPVGFRISPTYIYGVMVGNTASEPRPSHFYEVMIHRLGNFTIYGTTPNERVKGKMTWTTTDPFPT